VTAARSLWGWPSLTACAIACQQRWLSGRARYHDLQFFQNGYTASMKLTGMPGLFYEHQP
jgi:hypothetical protein